MGIDKLVMTGEECTHYYVIAPADGSTWLDSYCKKCGDSKQFRATPAQNKYVTQKFIVIDKEKSTEDIAEKESKDDDEW